MAVGQGAAVERVGVTATPSVEFVATDDGWQLALHCFPAASRTRRHPVLMVHGLAANRFNLDLDEQYSIPRAARARGFDVFLLELRGAGLSRPPAGRGRAEVQWGFSEFAEHDLPAAVNAVLAATGAPAVHAFGHSMGGMLVYSFAVRHGSQVRSIAALGAPLVHDLRLGARERRLVQFASRVSQRVTNRVPLRRVFGAGGRFGRLSSRVVDGILLNAANVDPHVVARLARESIDDIPIGLLVELTSQQPHTVTSGPFSYESELHRIGAPVLAVGGEVDCVAPPTSVAAAAKRIKGPDVRYRQLGIRHGDRADYGHLDMLVGRSAPTEVYPMLLDFWEEMD